MIFIYYRYKQRNKLLLFLPSLPIHFLHHFNTMKMTWYLEQDQRGLLF